MEIQTQQKPFTFEHPITVQEPPPPSPSTDSHTETQIPTQTQPPLSQSINPEMIVENVVADINVAEGEENEGPIEGEEAQTEAPPLINFLPKNGKFF